jgi:hypothetical protein
MASTDIITQENKKKTFLQIATHSLCSLLNVILGFKICSQINVILASQYTFPSSQYTSISISPHFLCTPPFSPLSIFYNFVLERLQIYLCRNISSPLKNVCFDDHNTNVYPYKATKIAILLLDKILQFQL